MTEDDLRAAFARHEPLTPPAGPVRAAIDRLAARRRRRRQRLRIGAAAFALVGVLGVVPQFLPGTPTRETPTVMGDRGAGTPTGALNVLLVGLDSAAGSRAPMADSLLIVHVPADRSRPYLISLPRDLAVPIPGHGTDKLNTAFARGAGPGLAAGYDLTRRTVTDLTGVRVDAGAVLTYPVLRELTDAMDGVRVCLPEQVRSSHTRRVFPAGCQWLDGAASVDLLRQRRDLPEDGRERDRDAQRYAAGLVRRAGEQGVLTNPVRLSRLLDLVGPNLTVSWTDGRGLPDLLRVVPDLRTTEPVGLGLPVGAADGQGRVLMDTRAAPGFLAAWRADRLAEWVAAEPGRVTRLR
ncbi:LCP family protein [Micromonospora endolithica]|uniref:LytR family transcriptional regulator n=1 Tax=Micromonospora endolithica TaxID=230091 RepID=A0A3A9ZED2_9ACTN|nr:LCP family protein [Micromonospora endolithica]RKN46469.1 LytR family transcriptional regulator [Micromonospora endolithica]TWJ24774.1 LytR family transcriptional attenuator [Micromonospora endolithica]